jgi:hypothetical protein
MLCYCDTDPQAGWALGGQISNKKKSAACDQFVLFFLFCFFPGAGAGTYKTKIKSDHCQSICFFLCLLFSMGWYKQKREQQGDKSQSWVSDFVFVFLFC